MIIHNSTFIKKGSILKVPIVNVGEIFLLYLGLIDDFGVDIPTFENLDFPKKGNQYYYIDDINKVKAYKALYGSSNLSICA